MSGSDTLPLLRGDARDRVRVTRSIDRQPNGFFADSANNYQNLRSKSHSRPLLKRVVLAGRIRLWVDGEHDPPRNGAVDDAVNDDSDLTTQHQLVPLVTGEYKQ